MGQQHARPAVLEAHAAEALLPHQHHHPDDLRQGGLLPGDDAAAGGGGSFPWLAVAGIGFLTVNSGLAVYRSQGDRGAVAFVAFSYLDLLALFYCLRRYEGAEPGSALRGRLKVAVWLLTTALTVLFSYKVAAVMPVAVAVVVWLMAFATVAGGFYGFFCYEDKQ